MKFIFTLLITSILSINCFSQNSFLTLTYQEVLDELKQRNIEIMESDSVHIHSVDGITYRNLIFYFTDSICLQMVTTFQNSDDFLKTIKYYDYKYKSNEPMLWFVDFDGGVDSIRAYRKQGYDMIVEDYIFLFEGDD